MTMIRVRAKGGDVGGLPIYYLPATKAYSIPKYYEMRVYRKIRVHGKLDLRGKLIVKRV